MVLDSIVNDRDYEMFEPELIADWRVHYASACARMKDTALRRCAGSLERDRPQDPEAAAELEELATRLSARRLAADSNGLCAALLLGLGRLPRPAAPVSARLATRRRRRRIELELGIL